MPRVRQPVNRPQEMLEFIQIGFTAHHTRVDRGGQFSLQPDKSSQILERKLNLGGVKDMKEHHVVPPMTKMAQPLQHAPTARRTNRSR